MAAEMDLEGVEEEVEVVVRAFPNMDLAQHVWKLDCEDVDKEAAKETVLAAIKEDKMAPFYESMCQKFGWSVDAALLAEMKAANEKELETLKASLANNEENEGETEVLDSLFEISKFHARIGAKTEAYEANDVIMTKPKVTSGKKIDASMAKVRVALFFMDLDTARTQIAASKALVEDGGDWDRRNRLKVYEAVFLMVGRDFKTAAALLLDGIATFTCVELCSYETFVYYALVTNMLFLDRPVMKKKLIDGPEVLGLIGGLDPMAPMLNGLYDCEYAAFFACLGQLNDTLVLDRYLAKHARYLVREFRILVYKQFLESYKSVMVATMAQAFGVSSEFLDSELSRFIASGRLNAKIDKVGGKVETNPPDERNSQYQAVIKKGDLLLTSIQKLARVIDA